MIAIVLIWVYFVVGLATFTEFVSTQEKEKVVKKEEMGGADY